ncbi:MAG: sensor histidine kinase [Chloroflexota bacterium]
MTASPDPGASDLHQARQMINQLITVNARLKSINDELDAFAGTVAHDIKNMVSSVIGTASLMKQYLDRMSPDDINTNVETILESGYQLQSTLDGLLLLAGVRKSEHITMTVLDTHAIVERCQTRLSQQINQSNAKIYLPDEWPMAQGYEPWVEEIWINYLSNAIKYGGKPPVIRLGAQRVIQPGHAMIRFWVRDNGGGIPKEAQATLFEPFTRLPHARKEAGHGLGLSIVRRIVERLGGTVDIESAPGHGSIFGFSLPAAE